MGAFAPNARFVLMPKAPNLENVALDGRYELHALIGEGAFGRVYRGRDRRLARSVAVKVIKPWWAEDPEWVAAFEREAQLLASVSDPGIVQIYDVGSAPEGLYYVAELVEGRSLVDRLREGPVAPAEARGIAEQLAGALASAHGRRVIHRDVKPANVLISRTGQVKVTDFGVARLAEGSTDGVHGTIVGTPRYMAPEQASGLGATPATDVYGVGVVLYEMLAGRPPFQGTSVVELAFSHVHDTPPPLPPHVSAPLADVVGRALAKDPHERFADGRAMARALSEADAGAVVIDQAPTRRHLAAGEGVTAVLDPPAPPVAPLTAAPPEPPEPSAPSDPSDPSDPSERPESSGPPGGKIPPTRPAAPYSPRQNVNPSGRRRRIALLGFVVLLGLGMVAAAIALTPGRVRVPNLHGFTRARVDGTLRHDHLKASFDYRYSRSAKGTVIAQEPGHGIRVKDGTTVSVTMSAGPAPVPVPDVTGQPEGSAEATLAHAKLGATVTTVPAPGVSPGQVTAQSPHAGVKILPHATVALSVAEVPQWRGLTSFSGVTSGSSVPFRIRGTQWRMVYDMGYRGACSLVFICSGPSATVTNVKTGAPVQHFDLDEGSARVWTFKSGPGVYEIAITPGSDNARWAVRVQDYY
jgi:eukaryotic-like serine/threonine-protein kinase